jgi:hemerythrin-like domain-containing protein
MRRPSEPFRAEHADIHRHLVHLGHLVGTLRDGSCGEQGATMARVVGFLREHLIGHADWEERVLYPLVDREAGSGPEAFTASMRREHRIIARWTDELAGAAAHKEPDVVAFSARAYNLLGLVMAHLEEEEDVLLPVLDRTMTAEEFEREVMSRSGAFASGTTGGQR